MALVGPIELTEKEKVLAAQFLETDKMTDFSEWPKFQNIQIELFERIAKRQAIPEARSRWFLDATYNIGVNKSRRDVFISNGCEASKIHHHPHFYDALKYFLIGASLDRQAISHFSRFWTELGSISSSDVTVMTAHARETTRQYRLAHRDAEEVFKLAIDFGLPIHVSAALRKAVMTASKR